MSFLLDFKDRIMEDAAIDDGVDRANRQYTVILFLIILIFLGLKQFVGDPIECFTPQYFSGAQEQYVNAYCWTASTYQVMNKDYNPFRSFKNTDVLLRGRGPPPLEEPFPESELRGVKHYVSYYQWIPIIIAVQAFLFYAPHLVWTSLAANSGVHIKSFLNGARNLGKVQGKRQEREELLEDLVEQFKRYIKVTRKLSKKTCCLPTQRVIGIGMKNGNFLCFVYLMVKLMYFANCIGQLYGLHMFLNTNLVVHGFNVLKGIVFNSDWTESPRFPINTICEFRGQPQLHGYLLSYTCHCVLPINLYNDKIYAIISLYLLTLTIITGFSFLFWVRKIIISNQRTKFIRHYLEVNHKVKEAEADGFWAEAWSDFTLKRLRPDGIFILMLVDFNLGNITADQLIAKLWDEAYKDFKAKRTSPPSISRADTLVDDSKFRPQPKTPLPPPPPLHSLSHSPSMKQPPSPINGGLKQRQRPPSYPNTNPISQIPSAPGLDEPDAKPSPA